MRNLILLRGCPRVGKSTFVRTYQLEPYTICPDEVRLLIQSPVTDISGKKYISQKNDKKVWSLVLEMLEERMSRGEFTVIDATHSRSKMINRYRELCKKYRYRCTVIPFDKPLETILEQNKNSEEYKQLPPDRIALVHERLKTDKMPGWVTVIEPSKFFSKVETICYNYNDYDYFYVVGDIHSSYDALTKFWFQEIIPNAKAFESRKIGVVFVGDYFDRGSDPVQTFRFMQSIMRNRNVLCLTGNHETNFFYHFNKMKVSPQFEKTLKAFEEEGIERTELKEFYNKLAQIAYFDYHDKRYVITHGGIPDAPTVYHPTQEFIKGVGRYSDSEEVDQSFCNNTPDNFITIHGHRNVYEEGTEVVKGRAYNLTEGVEFGKNLRVLKVTPSEITPLYFKNDKGVPESKFYVSKPFKGFKTDNEFLNALNKDNYIVKKDLENDIISYNYSKKAFSQRKWNERTCKARGLFVDKETEKVVARSYDKFFNYQERDETKKKNLHKTLTFPVSLYDKYNGFLGVLSVHKGEWFIASKTTNQGPYAGYFKELVTPYLTNKLKEFIEEKNVTFVFEAVDVENDPHIIEYEKSAIVLLDVIENSFEYKKASKDALHNIGHRFGFLVKELSYVFKDIKTLQEFLHTQNSLSRWEENIEGWVFEDSEGFMFKYKTRYYSFWKGIRWFKDMIVKKEGDHTELRNKLHSFDETVVYNKLITYTTDFLESHSIIEMRNLILPQIEAERKLLKNNEEN